MCDAVVSIEQIGVAHAKVLEVLHQASFDKFWRAEEFAKMCNQPGTKGWIAINATRQPVGFILIRCIVDEAEILTLCIDRPHRKQKIGNQLISSALTDCKAAGIRKMFLEVMQDNEPALGLYRRCGFKTIGERPGYYRAFGKPAKAAIVMEKAV